MDRDRSFRSLAVIAVLIAVVGVSVAFAALSQTLTITGTTKVGGSDNWKIQFANLSSPSVSGTATIDTPASLTTNSTTMNFAVSLAKPGDSVTYYFDVTNDGTIDAKISAITLSGVSQAAAQNIVYTLTYTNGTAISVGDTLNAGTTKGLKLVVYFDIAATNLPASDIELSLGATIDYTQN